MKDWKSTALGAALAVGDVAVNFLQDTNFNWSDPSNYIRPILLAALGYVVADRRSTLTPPR